jgi:hypothetical protein
MGSHAECATEERCNITEVNVQYYSCVLIFWVFKLMISSSVLDSGKCYHFNMTKGNDNQ